MLHDLLIAAAVRLRAQRPHGGALAAVQKAILDAGAVGGLCHLAAERVQLAHKMALTRAADGGVAGHIAHRVKVDGETDRFLPQPRACERGFNAGMARADDGDVVVAGKKFVHRRPLASRRTKLDTLFYHRALSGNKQNELAQSTKRRKCFCEICGKSHLRA